MPPTILVTNELGEMFNNTTSAPAGPDDCIV
jgi:hypothetical protein